MRFLSSGAESNQAMPGHRTPLSLLWPLPRFFTFLDEGLALPVVSVTDRDWLTLGRKWASGVSKTAFLARPRLTVGV
jgi:hypothetical protein